MNDVIELELITSREAECLHKMQVEELNGIIGEM